MARNDVILVDGIVDDRLSKAVPSPNRDEVFEYFAFEQILKFADLSPDEINSGWVDGRNDGGIDGFFIFINDHLLSDPATFYWPRGKADVSLWLITCKHHDTFAQVPVDKIVATISELLDFTKRSDDLKGGYSGDIIEARENLLLCYRTLSTRISKLSVRMRYASRGDTDSVGAEVQARAYQAEALVRGLFSDCDAEFRFVGATDLIMMERKARRYSLELPFIDCFAHGETYVLLTRLDDYARFVRDEEGELRRYLFESNVRDYVGLNRVNDDIAESLQNENGPDFWWLNNGITVLATKAAITGKAIVLDDVQIVNGLQTTESIARYFARGGSDPSARSVLVKIVKTDDSSVRDAIIRATNNQTEVEQQSLLATDKVQRDIEEVLRPAGWYYDRRKNYYANQGISEDKIVSPLYVAAMAIGVLRRSPSNATRLKQRHLRSGASFGDIFSNGTELGMWPNLISLAKRVEAKLWSHRPNNIQFRTENYLRTWRYLVSLAVVARVFGRFSITSTHLADLDIEAVSDEFIVETWEAVQDAAKLNAPPGKKGPNKLFVRTVCIELATKFNLADVEAVDPGSEHADRRNGGNRLPEAFLHEVDLALPPQPWKPGLHAATAQILGCSVWQVKIAINELIRLGKRNEQKGGVVYDKEGRVIAVDPERASPPDIVE